MKRPGGLARSRAELCRRSHTEAATEAHAEYFRELATHPFRSDPFPSNRLRSFQRQVEVERGQRFEQRVELHRGLVTERAEAQEPAVEVVAPLDRRSGEQWRGVEHAEHRELQRVADGEPFRRFDAEAVAREVAGQEHVGYVTDADDTPASYSGVRNFSCNSPFWYISITMSQPPWNSPET